MFSTRLLIAWSFSYNMTVWNCAPSFCYALAFVKPHFYTKKKKITSFSDSLMLSQEHYIEKILRRFGYFDRKFISALYDAKRTFKKI